MSLFGDLLSFGGSMYSAYSSQKGMEQTNAANAQIAAENRAWQEMMSSTAHQREVKDLRAAGLNPILSATGGSGASSPGGSIAVMQNPNEQSANIISNSAKTMSESSKNSSASSLNSALINKTNAETLLTKENINTQKHNRELNLSNAKAAALNSSGKLGFMGSSVPLASVSNALKNVTSASGSTQSALKNKE